MMNSQFSSPIPGLSIADQNRFYAEARRQQAAVVADLATKAAKAVGRVATVIVGSVTRGIAQARQLAELSQLSDRELADMGINRSDIPNVVVGQPVGSHHRISVPGLKGWTPSTASNDMHGSAAA